jgi:hypothetical protein
MVRRDPREESGRGYDFLNTTYEFSGIAYTPEPPAWTYAFSALSVIMVAQRKKLLSLFRDTTAHNFHFVNATGASIHLSVPFAPSTNFSGTFVRALN